ncbi:MAG: ParA family protein [Chthoniobacterales bacterium]|nr:ParA family protein [Chthoniobacterales bacterium]
MNILAVANQKGGVGKTTTSVNLAAALTDSGKRVLLIDLDPQGNATSALGAEIENPPTLYGPLTGSASIESCLTPTRMGNLSLIAANLDLAGLEIEVARMEDHLGQIRRALQPLRDSAAFDFAIIDCPPSLGILMTNALVAADQLLVPVQCEYYALEGLGKLMFVMGQIRDSGANPSLSLSGLVMTMFDRRTNLSEAVIKDVRDHFQEVLYDAVIPRSVRLSEAPSFGRTILEHDPGGPGARAYRQLAAEFLKRNEANLSFVNAPAAP